MRKIMTTVAAIVVLASLATLCSAQSIFYGQWEEPTAGLGSVPAWYGATGLIITPTALICPTNQVEGCIHQLEFDMKNQTIYGANVGLTPKLEIGVTHIKNISPRPPAQGGYTDETIMHVKYQLEVGEWFDNPFAPDVALGVWDWANELNRSYYLVLSKEVPMVEETTSRAMNVHVGLGNNDRDAGPLDGLFAGVELAPFDDALLQIEYDGDDINGALRYYIAPWISLDIGVVSDDLGWGVSATSNF